MKVNSFPPLTVCFSVRSSATWIHGQINNICNLSFVDQFNGLTRILVARQKKVGGNINIVSRNYQQVHGKEETKVICKNYCFGADLCFEVNSSYFGNFSFLLTDWALVTFETKDRDFCNATKLLLFLSLKTCKKTFNFSLYIYERYLFQYFHFHKSTLLPPSRKQKIQFSCLFVANISQSYKTI